MSSAVTALSNSGPAIHFEDVRIGFDEGDILRGVSFRVEPRETKILLGETGTGKTLTLKLAAGLLTPSAGERTRAGNGEVGLRLRRLRVSLPRAAASCPAQWRSSRP